MRISRTALRWSMFAALAGALGCTHASTSPGGDGRPSYYQPESAPYDSDGAPRSEAAAMGSDGRAAKSAAPGAFEARPVPQERPGLGTSFGESRYSPVRDVPFERQSDAPTYLASLRYNDAPGVEAMRTRLGSQLVLARSDAPVFQSVASGRPIGPADFDGVVIQVVDESGQPLTSYHVEGRVLLVGEHGQRYAIEVENRTGQRFEVVASVDGLDVVDGKTASLKKRGYVVAPYGHIHIDGYRRSMEEVAAFRFGTVRDSYAARASEFGDRHVGVIGVALFSERGVRPTPDLDDEARRRDAADPFPGRFAAPPTPRPYY